MAARHHGEQGPITSFNKSIRLGMVWCRPGLPYSQQFADLCNDLRLEVSSLVRMKLLRRGEPKEELVGELLRHGGSLFVLST